jgi:hypothetical protein
MIQLRPLLLSAVLALSAASCTEPLAPPEPGTVLFEVEYVNFAWGRSWHGFTVDADGRVYTYDVSDTNQWPSDDEVIPAAELEAKYAHHRRLVASVSPTEAAARYARVGDALAGSITPPQGVCADAGGTRYSALLYDADTGTYRRLLLHQRGDVARTNTSPAARDLFHWLADVTDTAGDAAVCDPYA